MARTPRGHRCATPAIRRRALPSYAKPGQLEPMRGSCRVWHASAQHAKGGGRFPRRDFAGSVPAPRRGDEIGRSRAEAWREWGGTSTRSRHEIDPSWAQRQGAELPAGAAGTCDGRPTFERGRRPSFGRCRCKINERRQKMRRAGQEVTSRKMAVAR